MAAAVAVLAVRRVSARPRGRPAVRRPIRAPAVAPRAVPVPARSRPDPGPPIVPRAVAPRPLWRELWCRGLWHRARVRPVPPAPTSTRADVASRGAPRAVARPGDATRAGLATRGGRPAATCPADRDTTPRNRTRGSDVTEPGTGELNRTGTGSNACSVDRETGRPNRRSNSLSNIRSNESMFGIEPFPGSPRNTAGFSAPHRSTHH